MRRFAATWIAWELFLAAFYVLLAGTPKSAEVAAGLLCGALAAVAYTVTKLQGALDFNFRLAWTRHLVGLPKQVVSDTGLVFATLWHSLVKRKSLQGRFIAVPFDFGGQEPQDAARRALIVAAASLAPNAYVVAVDRKEGLLLMHQLTHTPQPPGKGNREWPL